MDIHNIGSRLKQKVTIKDQSIDNATNIKDFREAIAEYIWNGFDAKATCVDVIVEKNLLGGIKNLSIVDNGTGIDPRTLEDTFGIFYASNKDSNIARNSSAVQGNKGKGRFAFRNFTNSVEWETVFYAEDENKTYKYKIQIHSHDKDSYELFDPQEIEGSEATKTTVNLSGFTQSNLPDIESEAFRNYLNKEFAWFLILNKSSNYKITINGHELDYLSIINREDHTEFPTTDSELDVSDKFDIYFIEWKERPGDKFYKCYFLKEDFIEVGKKNTTFNNNKIGFHHSVYVKSSFFNKYRPSGEVEESQEYLFKNDDDYKELLKFIDEYLQKQQKEFVRKNKEILIDNLKDEKVLPQFENTEYQKMKEEEFFTVVKELYTVIPQVFFKSSPEEKKTVLNFLNLLLDSNERENILDIIEQIVELTPEERLELGEALRHTHLSHVTNTINFIKNRYQAVELIKSLVFDNGKFTNERDHIQKVMEKNFWLLGEQFDKVIADSMFDKVLDTYLDKFSIDVPESEKTKFNEGDRKRRPDLLLSMRQVKSGTTETHDVEENIIVELKRPTTILTKSVMRQVEDYMDIILKAPEFALNGVEWKFFSIGVNVDEFVQRELETNRSYNKPGLYKYNAKYEIYAFTWGDLFSMFDRRMRFIVDKLKLDKKSLTSELAEVMPDLGAGKEKSDNLTRKLTENTIKSND